MFVGFCGYVKKRVSCIITSFCWPIRNSRKTSCRISGPFRCRLPWIPSPAILDAAGDRCRFPEEREWNPGNRFQQQKGMLLGGIPTLPLWKIWVRQWEGWHPIYIYIYTIYYGKKMFQTTNQNGFEFHLPWSIRITWILKVDFDLIVTFQGRNFNEVSARLEKTWSIAVLSVHLPGMLDNSDAPRYVLVRGFSGQLHPSLAVAPEFPWRSYFLHVFCQNTLKYVWLCTSQIFKHTILPLTIYGDVVMRLTP